MANPLPLCSTAAGNLNSDWERANASPDNSRFADEVLSAMDPNKSGYTLGATSSMSPQFTHPPEPSAEFLEMLNRGEYLDFSGRVRNIGDGKVVKWGRWITPREAMCMEYIRCTTTIPVPKVHNVFRNSESTFIVMDLVDGAPLEGSIWKMTEDQTRKLAKQLAGYISQLRALDPGKPMGAWPDGPHSNVLFKPPAAQIFHSMEEFHAYWLKRVPEHNDDPYFKRAREIIHEGGGSERSVLCHGDLTLTNIMVKGSEIVGIVDWECLGWYPDFWENTCAQRKTVFHRTWAKRLSEIFGDAGPMLGAYMAILYEIASMLD